MANGPVEFLAFSFPLSADDASIGVALRDIVESEQLDVIDLVVGERRGEQPAEFHEYVDAAAEFGLGELSSLRSLIATEDLDAVAESVGPDRRIVVLVIEHAWHRAVAGRAASLGGWLTVDEWVEPDDYLAALAADAGQAKGA